MKDPNTPEGRRVPPPPAPTWDRQATAKPSHRCPICRLTVFYGYRFEHSSWCGLYGRAFRGDRGGAV